MMDYARRHFLKTGLAVSATSKPLFSEDVLRAQETSPAPESSATTKESPRERLLMDFDWQFRLGNADDPSLDFKGVNVSHPEGQINHGFVTVFERRLPFEF